MREILFSAIFFFLLSLYVEGQVKFQKIYSDNFLEIRFSSIDTLPLNKGYIIAGSITTPLETTHATLSKIDTLGNVEWAKEYYNSIVVQNLFVENGKDSSFTLLANFIDTVSWNHKLILINTDLNGNLNWARGFGDNNTEKTAISISATIDSGYILSCYNQSSSSEVIKINSVGDTLWTKTYDDIFMRSTFQLKDSNYMIIGSLDTIGAMEDAIATKIDSDGNILWSKLFHCSAFSEFVSGVETYDGGYLFSGNLYNGGGVNPKNVLVKTNVNGDSLWTVLFDSVQCRKVIQDTDSGFTILGFRNLVGVLFKIDKFGNLLWTYDFSNGFADQSAILETRDDGYIIATSIATGGCIVKTDANGISGCDEFNAGLYTNTTLFQNYSPPITCSSGETLFLPIVQVVNDNISVSTICASVSSLELTTPVEYLLFPNPTSSTLILSGFHLSLNSVEVLNMLGEKVNYRQSSFSNLRIEIDVSNLNPGIYFVKVETENGTSVQKLVKQ